MRVAITGEKGFIGIHLTNYFKHILKYDVIELGRNYLESFSKIKQLDLLIHAAFIQRNPDPKKIIELNRNLTKLTIAGLQSNNINCNIIFISSTQEDLKNSYGLSKKEAKDAFSNYCKSINKDFISFKLPNIFGKYAVPNRTSFIATFCYNLHNDLPIKYNKNKINLCFIEDVISIIGKLEHSEITYTETTVENVYFLLKKFKQSENIEELPNLKSKFEFDLFSTFKSYKNYKI